MSIKERLQQYCDARHTKIGTFCRVAGISGSYFNQVKGGIGPAIRKQIEAKYKDLNVDWLITGEGEMLNPVATPTQAAVMSPYPEVEDAEIVGDSMRGDTVALTAKDCEMCPFKIPYVRGEYVQARDVNIREMIKKQPHRLEFRSMRDFIGSPDYAQKVITEAMLPDFQPGDVLFIQYLSDDAKVMSGAIYLVDTKSYGAMVRQVFVERDCYMLHSTNPDYKELKLQKEDIYSFALVLHSLRSNFRISSNIPDATSAFKKREEQVERLLALHADSMSEIRLQNERMAEERRRQDEERKAQFDLMVAERTRQDKLIEKLLNLK